MTPAQICRPALGFPPLVAGLFLCLLAAAAAFGVAVTNGIERFPEILFACSRNGMTPASCTQEALHAGGVSLAFHALLLLSLCGLFWQSRKKPALHAPLIAPEIKVLFLSLIFALLAAHVLSASLTLPTGSRVDDIARQAIFISLENLLWPFLIQLYVMETGRRLRVLLFAALIGIVALSPYRAVGLAVAVFAFLVPLGAQLFTAWREHNLRAQAKPLTRRTLLATTVCLFIIAAGYVDSRARTAPVLRASDVTNEYTIYLSNLSTDGTLPPPESRMRQRLAYPIYQAGIVKHLAETQDLPSPLDELTNKLRLTKTQTLNEYVYSRIYMGHGTGQTTSLLYGEAVAYAPFAPWLWMAIIPLALLGLWRFLARRGIDISYLTGIALWRGSQAGFVTLIPSLLLQIFGSALLVLVTPFLNARPHWQGCLKRIAWPAVTLTSFFCAALLTTMLMVRLLPPPALNAQFTTPDLCHFDEPKLQQALQNVAAPTIRYELFLIDTRLISLVIEGKDGAEAMMDTMEKALVAGVSCPSSRTPWTKRFPKPPISQPIGPMHLFALLAFIAGFVSLWKGRLPKNAACD